MEFRSGFYVLIVSELLQDVVTITLFSVLYGSITTIKGWSYPEALLLVGTFMLLTYITHGLFYRNFSRVSEYINEGRLDILLTKPVDTQFMMTTRYTAVADLFNIVAAVLVIGFALTRLQTALTIVNVLGYLSLIALGIIIIYSLWFMISLLAFWLTQIDEIQELWNGLFDYSKYPRQIFDGGIKIIFTFVLPILTIVSFPVEFFLGRVSGSAIFYNLALAVGLLLLTRLFWKVGLRRYASASS